MTTSEKIPVESGEFEASLKHAFLDAPTELSYTPSTSEQTEASVFALQSSAYYDLEGYLRVGISLPPSISRFRTTFPKDQLKTLTDLDPHIYTDLEVCLVDIHQHCERFNAKCFSKFIAISHSVIGFCEFFARRVEGKGCLREQIGILTDLDIDKADPRFSKALKVSQYLINKLSEEATKVQTECESTAADLHAFLITTKKDEERVDQLRTKLIDPGPEGKEPYNAVLGRKMAGMQQKLVDLVQQNKASLARKLHSPTLVVYTTCFGYFLGAASWLMSGLLDEIAGYTTAIADFEAKERVLTAAFHCVTHLIASICSIDESIHAAIVSLEGFTRTFSRLNQDFRTIAARISELPEVLGEDDDFIRDMGNLSLQEACTKWAEVKALATGFVTFRPREVTCPKEAQALIMEESHGKAGLNESYTPAERARLERARALFKYKRTHGDSPLMRQRLAYTNSF